MFMPHLDRHISFIKAAQKTAQMFGGLEVRINTYRRIGVNRIILLYGYTA